MTWSQTRGAPPLLSGNPGRGRTLKMSFANGERTWTESVNLPELLEGVLADRGHRHAQHDGWIELAESGFVLVPLIVEARPLPKGGAQTLTTIQIHHPTLIPGGVFEFQHSTGNDLSNSIRKGFDQWAQMDLVTLQDATQDQPKSCMTMVMEFPAGETAAPPRKRRAILGPTAHAMLKPPPAMTPADAHSFCPCCLLTNSFEAFKAMFEAEDFFGIRLFAARDAEGKPQADCRVNGEDFPAGAEALRKYVLKWPEAGYEFRKQYVALQTLPSTCARETMTGGSPW